MALSTSFRPTIERNRRSDSRPSLKTKVLEWIAPQNRAVLLAISICFLYLAWSASFGGTLEERKIIADGIDVLVALLGTIWSLRHLPKWRNAQASHRARFTAGLLTLSIAAFAVGAGVYDFYDLVLHQSPFPSWADAAYLTSNLAMVAGILLLPTRPIPWVVRVRLLVDGLMVVTAFVTFSWFFNLGPTLLVGRETILGRVLGVAYPVLDLVMICCLMARSAGFSEPRLRRVRNLLCVGVVAYIVSDSVYAYQTLKGIYHPGEWVDAGWMVTNLFVAQAAVEFRRVHLIRSKETSDASVSEDFSTGRTSALRTLLPYALVPAIGALLAYVAKTGVQGPLATGVYVGAGMLLALIMVRQVLAIAENVRLYRYLQDAYRELEALATTDAMTGLANHRVFQERLRQELEQTYTSGISTSLLLIDVDRFKAYNDGFGHPAGDEALKIVSRILEDNIRATDLAARYGGEEFAVVLSETCPEGARIVAERIRKACESTVFLHRDVTLSIGIAASNLGRGPSDLIEAADQALYAAKHSGRNRVAMEGAALTPPLRVESGWKLDAGRTWSLEASRRLNLDRIASSSLFEGENGSLIRALTGMLDLRDHEVERHSDRVMRFCARLAEEAIVQGVLNLSSDAIDDLYLGALLHDIGKVGVPDAILHKPGCLTAEEWAIVRQHPIWGERLLAKLPQLAGAAPIVRSHHERWDGGGYPDRLVGDAIPVGARLFALADTLDAMISERPYRKAKPFGEVRAEVEAMSGTQFDPVLVKVFLSVPEREWLNLWREDEAVAA